MQRDTQKEKFWATAVGVHLPERIAILYDWIESIEARTRKQAKYDKNNTTSVHLKRNIHTDRDILRWLWSQPSKQGSIKQLIREEIARQSVDR